MTRWAMFLMLALTPAATAAQTQNTGQITGTVTDLSGGPLIGAQVVVVGLNRGAIAGGGGRYVINGVPAGAHRVAVTLIGWAAPPQDVTVPSGGAAVANFQMTQQAVALSEIVTVGYGTQRRADVTGSVTRVTSSEIKEVTKGNAIEAIKGRMAGVDIVTTGYKPGDGVRVRIRGQRSLKASNDPLYVIDGIPMGGINDLNPSDIESIDVLKDASATAIYGSRAANGVVIVSTKKGSAAWGKTRITYDSYTGTQQPLRRVDMMNAQEYAQLKRESFRTVGKYKCPVNVKQCEEGDRDLFTTVELARLARGESTDWQDLVLRDGFQTNHQLSVAGGNERTQFSVSGNFSKEDGVVIGQDFARRGGRINFEHQATERLRVGASALITRSEQNLGRGDGVYGEALGNVPTGPPYDSLGNYIFKPIPDGQRVNPLADIANHIDERSRTRAFGTLFVNLNLASGLDWRMNFGPDLTFARRGQFRGAETQAKQGSGADALMEEDRSYNYTLDNLLTYRRDLATNHRVDATVLYSLSSNHSEEHNSSVSGLPYEHQKFFNLGSGSTIESVSSRLTESSLQSYMARINYGFMDRYLFTVTTRVDGSSRLAPGKKYAVFPSLALGWRLSEEPFIRSLGMFDNLKLRASYGRAGNTSVDPYQTLGGLSRTTYAFGDIAAYGYRPGSLPNPNLEWEKTDQVDLGFEFSVLKDRLSGTIDVYRAQTKDLLMDRQLPPTTGFTSITENIGETMNEGLEISLSGVVLKGWKGINWSLDGTFTTNHNEIVSLYGGKEDDVGNRWFIGQPVHGGGNSVYYDSKKIGIWQQADSALAAKYNMRVGQIRLLDLNDDGRFNDLDRLILGTSYPKYTASLSTRIEYRNFDLAALALTRQKFMVQNEFRTGNNQLFGRYNNLDVEYWLPDRPSNSDPRPNADQESPIYGGTRAYEDGSFVKIRNLTLGYTVPSQWTNQFRTESLRVYVTAQDPFMFTRFKGLDPEGRTSAGAPSYKSFLVGLTLGW